MAARIKLGLVPLCTSLIALLWLTGRLPSLSSNAVNSGSSWLSSWAAQGPCSPFASLGWLEPDLRQPLNTSWHSLEPACPPPPKWVQKIAQLVRPAVTESERATLLKELSFLRDQTIFFVGDSTDRLAIDWLSQLLYGRDADMTSIFEPEKVGLAPGWQAQQSPRYIHVRELGLRILNGFHFGISETQEVLEGSPTMRIDGAKSLYSFEDRVDELFKPMTDKLTVKPTLVVFQSLVWDERMLWATRRITQDRSVPYPPDIVEWYQRRVTEMALHLRRVYPKAALVMRGAYVASGADDIWRSDNWEWQLIAAQEAAMKALQVPYIPFARVWGGWSVHHGDHNLHMRGPPSPGAVALIWPVLHHLWRLSHGATDA